MEKYIMKAVLGSGKTIVIKRNGKDGKDAMGKLRGEIISAITNRNGLMMLGNVSNEAIVINVNGVREIQLVKNDVSDSIAYEILDF